MSLDEILGNQNQKLEAFYESLKHFYGSDKNIDYKTDLSDGDIERITEIDFSDTLILNEWKIDLKLRKITELFKKRRVSKKRLGRKEFVEMMKSLGYSEQPEKSSMKRLFGV